MQGDINAPGIWVRTMEDTFHDQLGKNIWVYMDDIFVFSNNSEGHVTDSKHTCSKLQHASYYAKPRKNVFFAIKLNILGHISDDDGIHLAREKVRTIMDCTRPESQRELQRFNGKVNHISRLRPYIATITAPLTEQSGKAE